MMSSIFRSVLVPVLVPAAVSLGALSAGAQTVDPRGVYFHSYAGTGFAGLEWITIVEQPGDRRYEFSDIRALVPFSGSIDEGGAIVWDTGAVRGTGQFSDGDTASFSATFGSSPFTSDLWRAPRTTPDFITEIDSPEAGRSALAGEFLVTIENLDPRTGAVLGAREETMILGVVGDTLRLTEPDGDFVQGVFEDGEAVGFRVVQPAANGSRYTSFVGSSTNRGQNLMGDLRFVGDDAFTATMLLQTRTAPGAQTQFVEHYSAVRVPAPATVAVIGSVALFARRRR